MTLVQLSVAGYWADANFAGRMTSSQETDEIIRGRQDAKGGVPRDAHETPPYLLGFDHCAAQRREQSR